MSFSLSEPMDDLRMSDSSESSNPTPEIRKRKRADYSKLSPDERTQKRKLKNRMSAQQARDRKKQYVTELEEQVRRLEKENAALRRLCSTRGNTDSAVISSLPWTLLLLLLTSQACLCLSQPGLSSPLSPKALRPLVPLNARPTLPLSKALTKHPPERPPPTSKQK